MAGTDTSGNGRGKKRHRSAAKIGAGLAALLLLGLMASGALADGDPFSALTAITATSSTSSETTSTPATASDTTSTSVDVTTPDAVVTTAEEASTTPPLTTTAAATLTPSISTDKSDYPQGATVTLTGAGWGAGESVHLFVNDTVGQTWSYGTDVVADATGTFTLQFQLASYFISDYDVTATGAAGESATTSFTDAGTLSVSPASGATGTTVTVTSGGGFFPGGATDIGIYWDGTLGTTNGTLVATCSANSGGNVPATSTTCTFNVPGGAAAGNHAVIATRKSNTALSLNQSFNVTAPAKHTTSTSVSCATSPVTYGGSTTCTATVSDTATSGQTTPAGTVTFSTSGTGTGGTFGSTSCALSGGSCSVTYTPTAVGTTAHTIGASYAGDSGHNGSNGSTLLTVNKKPLTVTGITASDKAYDGSTAATLGVTSASLQGQLAGDSVTLDTAGATGTFADKNVGTSKTVTVSGLTIGGTSSSNYTLTQPTTTASITAKTLTVTGITASDKAYDATTTATLGSSAAALQGVVAGDAVTLSTAGATGAFADKNVGPNKTVTVSGLSIGGAAASNYALTQPTTKASITPLSITGSFGAADKVYDGTTAASVVSRSLNGVLGSDSVSLSGGTGAFADKDAGASKTVTLTGAALAGADAGNYALGSVATAKAAITPKPLTGAIVARNKVYDGTDAAVVAAAALPGVVGSDVVSLSVSHGHFADKNVGSAKTVTADIALAGADAGDYSLTASTASTTADITPLGITGSFTSAGKVYDGTTDAAVTGRALTGVLGSDDVSLTGGDASFGSKDVGTDKTVSLVGATLAGADRGNYTLGSVATAKADVTPKPLTGAIVAENKVYNGSASAVVAAAALPGVVDPDVVTLSASNGHFADANVGSAKTVTADLALGGADDGNYSLSSSTAATTADIAARPITVAADPQTKVYGADDPAFTYQITDGSLVAGDSLAGELARVPGTDVGTYAIGRHTLTAGSNYDLTYVPADLTITRRPVEVTADSQSKVYGDDDPALTYRVTDGSLASGDGFTGALAREAGQGVGQYDINQGSLDLGGNYDLSFKGAKLTIGKRPVEVTADAQSKVYGDDDPPLTYRVTDGSLASGDGFRGALAREAGQGVGEYAITQGSLGLGGNYDLSFKGAKLTIGKRPVEVTADAQSKVYGDDDPALTYQVTGGSLAYSDAFTGALARDAGQDVGQYHINQGTLDLGGNYDLTFKGAKLTIGKRPVEVTADAQSKVYGDDDPALTYQVTHGSLASGDGFTGALAREAGQDVGHYAISQGTLDLGGNYDLSFNGANLAITKRPVEVTADTQSKTYGDDDPPLTYRITSGSLAYSDTFAGGLARDPGRDVGDYAITRGTLDLGPNYDLNFEGAKLTVAKRPVEVTADDQSKTYGNADPALTYHVTDGSLAYDDGFSGGLVRDGGESIGDYPIRRGTLALGANYDLTFKGAKLTIGKRPVEVTADAQSKTYGNDDPALSYQVTDGSLAAGDSFAGALAREAGQGVGEYAITRGSLDLGGNYDLSFKGAKLTITKRAVEVTADPESKTYGDGDPALTYRITNGTLAYSDTFSGALARDDGQSVGQYAITQGSLDLGGNYDLSFKGAKLTITKRPVGVTADAQSKIYGDDDPGLTYRVTEGSLAYGDAFSGALARDPGQDVGRYDINQGSLDLGGNYDLSFKGAKLTIGKRPVEVTADARSKTYGNDDPALTYQVTHGSLAYSDAFSGALTRDAGRNIGQYAITQGTLDLGPNYALSFVGAKLTIGKRSITVTAAGNTKTYDGATTASATPTVTSGSIADGDTGNFTEAYQNRNVGTAKTLVPAGSVADGNGGANYAITFANAAAGTIQQRAITVTAAANTKTYDGGVSAAATPTVTAGSIVDGDTGTFTETYQNRDAGSGKVLVPNGYVADGNGGGNYAITFTSANTGVINPRSITVTAATFTKTYDGTASAGSKPTVTSGSIVSPDAGSFTEAFENKNAGTGKVLVPSGAVADGNSGNNYAISFVNDTTGVVNPAPLTITADNKTKVLNAPNPAYTVTYGAFVPGDTSASLNGTPTFATNVPSPEQPGSWTITPAGLSSPNYQITFKPGTLTILYAAGGTCNGDAGHQILQPINADGTSVFKQGSTVPAKFRVCDAAGKAIGTPGVVAAFRLVQTVAGTQVQAVDEAVDSTTPDTAFRWSSTDQQWIFNINTKSLSGNKTYSYEITLNDGSKISFRFGLK